ncbi:hypothetical protein FHT40_003427 [Mycolicibacterium sp. BK556]|nr:hypothetical protein [Mycolicibacterium sp. BK556]MBB3633961.1 hypothetical protein [Mycolicibacterium sp. BK607]
MSQSARATPAGAISRQPMTESDAINRLTV